MSSYINIRLEEEENEKQQKLKKLKEDEDRENERKMLKMKNRNSLFEPGAMKNIETIENKMLEGMNKESARDSIKESARDSIKESARDSNKESSRENISSSEIKEKKAKRSVSNFNSKKSLYKQEPKKEEPDPFEAERLRQKEELERLELFDKMHEKVNITELVDKFSLLFKPIVVDIEKQQEKKEIKLSFKRSNVT